MTYKLLKPFLNLPFIWRFLTLFSLGFMIFIFAAYTAPNLYYNYFDTTPYYTLAQPVVVDEDTVKPGGTITLHFERLATADLVTNNNSNLVVTNKDGNTTRISIGTEAIFAITKNPLNDQGVPTKAKLVSRAMIPKEAILGTAHLEGAVVFTIHSVSHTYIWKTEEFQIIPN